MGIPSAENEAHAAKAGQAFKFLADMRDPYIRAVALDQLRETVAKRARHLDPNKAENLVDFLKNSATPGEGRAADLQSLWSHCRASLIIGYHTGLGIPAHRKAKAAMGKVQAGILTLSPTHKYTCTRPYTQPITHTHTCAQPGRIIPDHPYCDTLPYPDDSHVDATSYIARLQLSSADQNTRST